MTNAKRTVLGLPLQLQHSVSQHLREAVAGPCGQLHVSLLQGALELRHLPSERPAVMGSRLGVLAFGSSRFQRLE